MPTNRSPRPILAFLLPLTAVLVAQKPVDGPRAQDAKGGGDAAVALEKEVEAALAKLGPAHYRARTWRGDGEAGVVDVVAGRAHGVAGVPLSRPLVVRWEPQRAGEPTVRASFDGRRLLQQMPETNEVLVQTLKPDGGFSPLPIFFAALPGFGGAKLFPRDDAVRARGEPVLVDERLCDVLVATSTREDEAGSADGKAAITRFRDEVAVDAKTRIPVRRETVVSTESGGQTTVVYRSGIEMLGDLHLLAAEPDGFEVPVPAGWKLVDVGPADDGPRLATGDAAPDWTLADHEGRERKLSEMRGRVVLLDFWATWCGPCKELMPELQKLHERFASRGLAVAGISVREKSDGHEGEKGGPAGYFAKMKYTYLGLVKGEAAAEAYGVSGIPHVFLIGRDGKIVFQHVGAGQGVAKKLAEEVEKLLDK